MAKEKIPVYDIRSLNKDEGADYLVERFTSYLDRHDPQLHLPHRHSFYHLVLFTSGTGSHQIDFTRFKVKPFQIYFMIPGQVHSWDFESEVDGFIINFSETLFKSFLQNPNYLERFGFFGGVSEESVCQLGAEVRPPVVGIFEAMLAPSGIVGENKADMFRLLLLQLFILIDNSCSGGDRRAFPLQKQTLLRTFRRLIDSHYRDLRLPKEYADLLYITPNHLNALCVDLLGKTAGELIRDRSVLEAKRLLTNAKMTAAEIAYELNFKDNSYFNRFFKKNAGMTPDDFRKSLLHIKNK